MIQIKTQEADFLCKCGGKAHLSIRGTVNQDFFVTITGNANLVVKQFVWAMVCTACYETMYEALSTPPAEKLDLVGYIRKYAVRGACTCGKCVDAVQHPENEQPEGHTVNMTFFEVAAAEGAKKEDLLELVKAEYPEFLNGAEHNYLDIGAKLGDQGLAIMLIGLGHLLDVWTALTPDTMLPDLPGDTKKEMAGRGMISLLWRPK